MSHYLTNMGGQLHATLFPALLMLPLYDVTGQKLICTMVLIQVLNNEKSNDILTIVNYVFSQLSMESLLLL
jgi:hypothetical protein